MKKEGIQTRKRKPKAATTPTTTGTATAIASVGSTGNVGQLAIVTADVPATLQHHHHHMTAKQASMFLIIIYSMCVSVYHQLIINSFTRIRKCTCFSCVFVCVWSF